MNQNEILVFPQGVFTETFSLLPWEDVQSELSEIESSFGWMDRLDAEHSTTVAQAIPCTLIRNSRGHLCVLRRVRNERKDLDGKLSLVVGGHIDDKRGTSPFMASVNSCLIREMHEEVGIRPEDPPRPIGVIVDKSSPQAARHVAFLHETTTEHISIGAPEEFAPNSKYRGVFMRPAEIADRQSEFDPWSQIVISTLACPTQPRLI